MKNKFQDSKVKEIERLLLYNHITESINNKPSTESTLGFSLCSSSVVLERHLANYANKNKKAIGMICAETNTLQYKIAKEKLSTLRNNYFNSVIFKIKDYLLFKEIQQSKSKKPNKLDFAWHDWCGFMTEDKIKTICMSSQLIKEGGLLSVTLSAHRDKDMSNINKFLEFFDINSLDMSPTEKKAYLIPSLLNFKLAMDKQKIKKGLTLLDAIVYQTSFGKDRVGATTMLFYIFRVETRDKIQHNSANLKQTIKQCLEKIVCHNNEIFIRKDISGLR